MGDIEYWRESLQTELGALPALTERISQSQHSGPYAVQQAIQNAEAQLKKCVNIKKSYKLELRLMIGMAIEKQKFESYLQDLDKELQSCNFDLGEAKDAASRSELMSGRDDRRSNPEQDGDNMLMEAGKLQDKTKESLMTTQNLIHEAKDVGVSTLEELGRQRGQIVRVTDDVMAIEGELARAEKLIRNFSRRMATDKFIQCFTCVNILLLLGVIGVIYLARGDEDFVNIRYPCDPTVTDEGSPFYC